MARIPNIFHFVFGLKPQTEPFHLSHYLCLASCMAVNKPDRIYFHYKHMPYGEWWDRIKPHLTLKEANTDNFIGSYTYTDQSVAKYRYAHLSDILRLEALVEYGGFYADIDTLFVNPIPLHFYHKPFILGKEKVDSKQAQALKAEGSLCNAWIGSEKGSEFAKLWLERIYQEFDGTWSAHSTFLPYKLSVNHPSLIHVEPERSFFHFDWTKEGIRNIFVTKTNDTQNIYSIHLWSHLWWDPQRRDFTTFNYKKLTQNYVRYSDTTFGHIARRYLPEDVKSSYSSYLLELTKHLFNDLKMRLS